MGCLMKTTFPWGSKLGLPKHVAKVLVSAGFSPTKICLWGSHKYFHFWLKLNFRGLFDQNHIPAGFKTRPAKAYLSLGFHSLLTQLPVGLKHKCFPYTYIRFLWVFDCRVQKAAYRNVLTNCRLPQSRCLNCFHPTMDFCGIQNLSCQGMLTVSCALFAYNIGMR